MARSVFAFVILTACAADAPPAPTSEPFPSERGFVELDGRHVFYVLFSADQDPASAPLFVLFNGGPGFPTTLGLLPGGTGPVMVDQVGAAVGNDASFTTLGSLLYLDQPATGFSYDDARLGSIAFDPVADAEAFARATLAVIDAHPVLAASDVVLVGESYGGLRAQLMLDDPRLAERVVAQILIEPYVMGELQSQESHLPEGDCTYDTRQGTDCRPGLPASVLADRVIGSAILGGPLEDIPGLASPDRHGAPRAGFEDTEPALIARLGPLADGDAYFAGGPYAFPTDERAPAAFARNLAHVATFITHAVYDGVVDSTAIGRALTDAGFPATFDSAAPAGAARGGEWTVALPSGPVTIRMPTYAAGHMVAQGAGPALRADIASWLRIAAPRMAR